jgi:hypothetical protein
VIPFTDFPLESIKIFMELTGTEDGKLFQVLLLPSEH